jgi:hypothetical protein
MLCHDPEFVSIKLNRENGKKGKRGDKSGKKTASSNSKDTFMADGFVAHIGVDSEYVATEFEGKVMNSILSYQLWCEEIQEGVLILPQKDERFSLKDICALSYTLIKRKAGVAPALLRLVSHFWPAELYGMNFRKDFFDWANNIAVIQKSFSSIRPDLCRFSDTHRHIAAEVGVSLHDTFLLSGTNLSALGDSIGFPKIDIGEDIQRMDELREKDFDRFVAYAMTDAVICCRGFRRLLEMARDIAREDSFVPLTASSIGSRALLNSASEEGKEFLHPLERRRKTRSIGNGKFVEHKTAMLPDHVYYGGVRSYKGGRNETYLFGLYPDRRCYDYDLCNAYPTAMLCIDDVDWSRYTQLSDGDEISPFDIGFVEVLFQFKKDCKFPMFPVKPFNPSSQTYDENLGICFPRSGKTVVTLAEYWTAKQANVLEKCEICDSLVFKRNGNRTLPRFVKNLILRRGGEPKGSVNNHLLKLVTNSLYGKITQGISKKKSIDLMGTLKEGCTKTKKVPSSDLFNPMIAASITGIVRAAVGEIMLSLEKHRRAEDIICCTTDGIMVFDAPLPKSWLEGKGLPLCEMLAHKRKVYLGEAYKSILELKHFTDGGCVSVKTRNYWMFPGKDSKSHDLLVARGGMSTKGMDKSEAIRFLTSKFCRKDGGFENRRLTSQREYLSGEVDDLISIASTSQKNWDYDLKRKPLGGSDSSFLWEGTAFSKICFGTEPWKTASEFVLARSAYKNWKNGALKNAGLPNTNKIQSKNDLADFFEYMESNDIRDTYSSSPENIIITKMIMILGKLGYSGAETAKILGIERSLANSRRRSKTFRDYIAGKKDLRMPDFVPEKYDNLIKEKISSLPEELQKKVSEAIYKSKDGPPYGG